VARPQWILLALIAVEIAVFGLTGANFLSWTNAVEMLRVACEIGLIALASTCVIVAGGIDLSTGSLMGLSAVALGALHRDVGLPLPLAIAATLSLGALCGGLNALFVTRFRTVPLIATLGTYSLFRGLAEGFTNGARAYGDFGETFASFGRGGQAVVLAVAAIGFWVLLERSRVGRGWRAIGFSPDGAWYARVPVARRLALAYVLSGLMASLAGVIYVARIGQAKADAGMGYELSAIAAVVLGGTSIFGGRGTVAGTLLGLAAIVVLQTGLRLASLPAELAGIAMGALLIVAIALAERRSRWVWVIAGALTIAVCAWAVVRPTPPTRRVTVAMMPKAKGDPYFISCRKGAEEAAARLGVELLWDGPTDLDPAKQSEIAESWITRGVDAIAVAVANRDAIAPVLAKARARGIKVLTWDADSRPESRDAFVNQATPQAIGETLTDEAARLLGGRGDFAIVTGALTAANQNEWIVYIKRRLERYPGLRLIKIVPSDDDRDRAFAETQTLIKAEPSVKLFMGIAAPAVPGAGEAVKQTGRSDLFVVGLSLPNLCKPYVRAGVVQSVVLWDTVALGRLTVESAVRAVHGETLGPEIVLGAPLIFTRANIENYDF